jgi:hypothetical protein
MNQYQIFKHPDGKIELIKQGWSWTAFSGGFIWGCYKKLWFKSIGIFLLSCIASYLLLLGTLYILPSTRQLLILLHDYVFHGQYVRTGDVQLYIIENGFMMLMFLAMFLSSITLGLKGMLWHAKNLVIRGFEEVDTVEALNSESAMAVYLKSFEKS